MSLDHHYPTVDFVFIRQQINSSEKIVPDSEFKVGDTTTFVIVGKQPLYKRKILVRELEPGLINYMQATGLALRFNFMGNLLQWLEQNKNWKDGGYFVAAPSAAAQH